MLINLILFCLYHLSAPCPTIAATGSSSSTLHSHESKLSFLHDMQLDDPWNNIQVSPIHSPQDSSGKGRYDWDKGISSQYKNGASEVVQLGSNAIHSQAQQSPYEHIREQLFGSRSQPSPIQHIISSFQTQNSDKRKEKKKVEKSSKREHRSNRWKGLEWQEHFTHQQQSLMYALIKAEWPKPYEKLRYRAAYNCLRGIMDVETCKKIISGHRKTIIKTAQATANGERARLAPLRQQSSLSSAAFSVRWPDPDLSLQKKKIIMRNLKSYWKETGSTVRGRLKSYYESHLAPALMDITSIQFKEAADYIHQRTMQGKLSGAKRTRGS